MKEITITIEGYKITIEKEEEIKTAPIIQPLIQYNEIDIKRKYYKKGDLEYKRKPIKTISKILKFDKVVKQEPLLDFHLKSPEVY